MKSTSHWRSRHGAKRIIRAPKDRFEEPHHALRALGTVEHRRAHIVLVAELCLHIFSY